MRLWHPTSRILAVMYHEQSCGEFLCCSKFLDGILPLYSNQEVNIPDEHTRGEITSLLRYNKRGRGRTLMKKLPRLGLQKGMAFGTELTAT